MVLHFWTRTCEPCIDELQREIPVFDEVVRGRDDVALLLVTVDANWAAVAPLVPNGLRAPVLFDPSRRVVGGKYGTRLFPETWVVDPAGVIRARLHAGGASSANLLAALGGRANVRAFESAPGRLLVTVADSRSVDGGALQQLGARGVALPSPHSVHILHPDASLLERELASQVG